MRLVFAGTPAPAVVSLATLLDSRHDVAAVVTRPDAPAGRGRQSRRSPVAELADSAGIPVLAPRSARDPGFAAALRELAPDCVPVVAFGAIIPAGLLEIPRHGWVNLHFSLLPAWRGAAPVQHAVLHGDDITGASTFQIVPELDAGPVFGVVTERIQPADTSGDLLERLAVSGARLLLATLDAIEQGTARARDQPADGVSFAPKILADEVRVDWSQPALRVDRLVRAATPAPGAWTTLRGERVKLCPVSIADPPPGAEAAVPGQIEVRMNNVLAATGTDWVRLGQVKGQGKREMPAGDWARGLRLEPGEHFG